MPEAGSPWVGAAARGNWDYKGTAKNRHGVVAAAPPLTSRSAELGTGPPLPASRLLTIAGATALRGPGLPPGGRAARLHALPPKITTAKASTVPGDWGAAAARPRC